MCIVTIVLQKLKIRTNYEYLGEWALRLNAFWDRKNFNKYKFLTTDL